MIDSFSVYPRQDVRLSVFLSPDGVYSDLHPSIRTAERNYLAVIDEFVKLVRFYQFGRIV